MSKHTAPANLTTSILEHQAKAVHIISGRSLTGSGRHRGEAYSLRQLDTSAGHGTYVVEVAA